MPRVSDFLAFEARMRQERGWKRGELCQRLGISQNKWRRLVEDRAPEESTDDHILALAMAAVGAGLDPFPADADAWMPLEANAGSNVDDDDIPAVLLSDGETVAIGVIYLRKSGEKRGNAAGYHGHTWTKWQPLPKP